MSFWNKERKTYAMIVIGGALAYMAYRKFGTSSATSTPSTGATTNFTGVSYYSADGGHECHGGHDCGCADCGRTCEQLATELSTVRAHIANGHNYTTDHLNRLHHRENELTAKMTAKGCTI